MLRITVAVAMVVVACGSDPPTSPELRHSEHLLVSGPVDQIDMEVAIHEGERLLLHSGDTYIVRFPVNSFEELTQIRMLLQEVGLRAEFQLVASARGISE